MSATGDNTAAARNRMSWPQMVALAIGAIYLLIGVIGFFVTGLDDFAAHTDEALIGFSINPLHNVVHILIGVAGLVLARTLGGARTYGWLLAVGYGAAFIYGLFAVGNEEPLNFLSINWADNWLHLVSALAGLAIALGPVRDAVTDRSSRA